MAAVLELLNRHIYFRNEASIKTDLVDNNKADDKEAFPIS